MKIGPDRRGAPGEPGELGQRGIGARGGSGGKGGTGGQGGRGGVLAWVEALLLCMFVVLAVGVFAAVNIAMHASSTARKANANTAAIRILEQQHAQQQAIDRNTLQRAVTALAAARGAEYRICLRQQTIRVAVNFDNGHDEPKLPLYDCTPNLTGRPAVQLTAAQAATFSRKVKQNHFTP